MLSNFIIFNMIKGFLVNLPTPKNINLWWNFGSMASICLLMQLISGLFLTFYYIPNINFAFFSVIYILNEVNMGWIVRLIHMNGASLFFICVYIHICRGIYYQSYNFYMTWLMGVIMLFLLMAVAFMGYILPWGQMSFWGATVITNLMSAIPFLGFDIVQWLWGGFSVGNSTLSRFYSFHFIFPFLILLFLILHLIFLHEFGSNNPLGLNSNLNKIPLYFYFILKDFMSFIIMWMIFLILLTQYSYILGDCDNFIFANPMITPVHIQPEWYFLFAYAILRSIPNKLGGVIALLFSILILLLLCFLKNSKFQSSSFYFFSKFYFWLLLNCVILLTWIGKCPVEYPFIEIGQFLTILYFSYFFFDFYFKKKWDEYIN